LREIIDDLDWFSKPFNATISVNAKFPPIRDDEKKQTIHLHRGVNLPYPWIAAPTQGIKKDPAASGAFLLVFISNPS
jgi:hypothetical protein